MAPRGSKTVTVSELDAMRTERTARQNGTGETTESAAEPVPPDLYPVPADAAFGSGDVMPAPDLAQVARNLIETSGADIEWLRTQSIAYRWVRKGGSSGGHRRLGDTVKPSKLWRSDTKASMIIWLAADTLRELRVRQGQVEAILFERLVAIDRDESGRIRKGAPDFTGYLKAVRRFGTFTAELQRAADAFSAGAEDVRNMRLDLDDVETAPESVAAT